MMDIDEENDIEAFRVDQDIQAAKQQRQKKSKKRSQTWAPLFFTNDLLKEHDESEFEAFQIPNKQLKTLGR